MVVDNVNDKKEHVDFVAEAVDKYVSSERAAIVIIFNPILEI